MLKIRCAFVEEEEEGSHGHQEDEGGPEFTVAVQDSPAGDVSM